MMSVEIKSHKTVSAAISNVDVMYSHHRLNGNQNNIPAIKINQPSYFDEQGYQTTVRSFYSENFDISSTYTQESGVKSIYDQIHIPILPPKSRRKIKVKITKKIRVKPSPIQNDLD